MARTWRIDIVAEDTAYLYVKTGEGVGQEARADALKQGFMIGDLGDAVIDDELGASLRQRLIRISPT